MKFEKKHFLLFAISIIVTMAMVGLAEVLNKEAIIFPEIAALCTGLIISPKKVWNSDRYTSWGLLCFSSLMGIIIVRYAQFPLFLQCIIALCVIVVVLMITKSTFFPAICAIMLPVLTHSGSLYYVASVCGFSAILFIIEALLVKHNLKDAYTIDKMHLNKTRIAKYLLVVIAYSLLLTLALHFNEVYLIVPPLCVTFFEIATDEFSKKRPFDIWLILSIAGGLGFLLSFMINSFGWSYFGCTLVIILVLYIVMFLTKLTFPPAGAICLLPLILPSDNIYRYPLEIMIGGAIVIILGYIINKLVKENNI